MSIEYDASSEDFHPNKLFHAFAPYARTILTFGYAENPLKFSSDRDPHPKKNSGALELEGISVLYHNAW
jgi:hypothetical protein